MNNTQHNKLVVTDESAPGTPSDTLVQAAKAEFTTADSAGRIITLKKPGVLAQYNLVKVLGDAAKNEVYMGMVMPLIFVAAIDGNVIRMPNTQREVDALIQRLDEHGIEAVMKAVEDKFGKVDPEKDKAELKN